MGDVDIDGVYLYWLPLGAGGTVVPRSGRPALTWGRDELGAADMRNSNSLIAWLLGSAGLEASRIRPPRGGRAPGWDAGVRLALRQGIHV